MTNDLLSDRLYSLITLFDSRLKTITHIWERVSADWTWGGYLTSRDRAFALTSTDKGAWGQGRQVYTFAAMAEYDCDNRAKWLEASKLGLDFIINKMLDGNLRVNYLVDQTGRQVLEGPISIFSDAFTIAGLAKYIHVSNDQGHLSLLQTLFDQYIRNVLDPSFTDIVPYEYREDIIHHSVFMIATNVAMIARPVIGPSRTDAFIGTCLSTIFDLLHDEGSGSLFERKHRDGTPVEDEGGRLIHIGHVLESMWFCLDAACALDDKARIQQIIEISERTFSLGNCDGLPLFAVNLDETRSTKEKKSWAYEPTFGGGDKVSWVFAETMVLFAKLYELTDDERYLERLQTIHTYVEEHFWDPEYGDWFHALNEEGVVIESFKGSTVKNAYHIPRAYLEMIGALQRVQRRAHATKKG